MRERPLFFRERPDAVLRMGLLRRAAPHLLLFGGTGLLLAHVGAFGTGERPLTTRLPYFLGLCLLGGVVAASLTASVRRGAFGKLPPASAVLLVIVAVVVVLTPVVWVAAALVLNGSWSPTRLIPLAGQVAPLAALLVPVGALSHHKPKGRPNDPPGRDQTGGPSNLSRRLPPELRCAPLLAVAAEDHYLRVHTELGSALILMRFSDALRFLREVEGAQTHRSWWVSRGAVLDVRRGDGRASLSLRTGLEVPVSRRYARHLRQLRWF